MYMKKTMLILVYFHPAVHLLSFILIELTIKLIYGNSHSLPTKNYHHKQKMDGGQKMVNVDIRWGNEMFPSDLEEVLIQTPRT